MSTIYVKENGQWIHPKSIYVKDNGQWKLVKSAWIKDNGTWKLGYASSTGTVTFSTPTLGGIFVVPEDIYELRVRYPDLTSSTYVTEQTISVKPGEIINYSIGDYGQISSFGPVAAKAFDKVVAKWSGDLDTWLYQRIGMVTGTNVISTSSLGNTTQLMSDLGAANIYYYQDNIDFHETVAPVPDPGGPHGDWNYLTGTISISTIPIPYIQGDVRAYLSENPVIAGGSTVIEQQPSTSNNYVVQLMTVDPQADPRISTHYWQLNLQQINPITVTWGDWPPEDLYPISASISLTAISTSTGSAFTAPSGTQPYSIYAGGAVRYSVTATNLTTGTLYYSVKTTKGRIPTSDNIFVVSGNFTATTTFSDGITHNSYGTVNVVNSSSTATFTIAVSTSSFLNMGNTSLISRVEIYKTEERSPASLLCSGPYINIIPPASSVLNNSYCGTPAGTFDGNQYSLYTVVADGIGGYILTNEQANSELCGYTPPPFDYGGGSGG